MLGLVLSGGSDRILYAFSPNINPVGHAVPEKEDEPMYALLGHEANITCIIYAESPLKNDVRKKSVISIFSSSWDCTIRCWEDWVAGKVFTGHSQAVWSIILLSNGNLASGINYNYYAMLFMLI